jgi:hypothetical protein
MFTQEKADAICARLAEGPSLRKVCEEIGVTLPTFLRWVSERPELADQYAHARSIGRSIRFEALREIAASEPERDQNGRIDPGWVAWKRMHIDAEKWSLSKEDAKKYGDKLESTLELGDSVTKIVREIIRG